MPLRLHGNPYISAFTRWVRLDCIPYIFQELDVGAITLYSLYFRNYTLSEITLDSLHFSGIKCGRYYIILHYIPCIPAITHGVRLHCICYILGIKCWGYQTIFFVFQELHNG